MKKLFILEVEGDEISMAYGKLTISNFGYPGINFAIKPVPADAILTISAGETHAGSCDCPVCKASR